MTHSQMVQTRRRKQAGKKALARAAKLAKKTHDTAANMSPRTSQPGSGALAPR